MIPDPRGVYRSQLMFRSIRHEIFTLEVIKVALNKNDDKCIAKKDRISILARGHKDLSWSPTLENYLLLKSVNYKNGTQNKRIRH